MKLNNKWMPCGHDRNTMIYKYRIPKALKVPALGKFIVYTLMAETWKNSHKYAWAPTNEDLDGILFEQNVHMITGIELNHPKPRHLMDNIADLKVVWNDTYKTIIKEDLKFWFYCPLTENLKGYDITITGAATAYPKNTFKNLIELSGGVYSPKPTDKTNLVINCSSTASNTILYAKKHGIKMISESEFFKFFV